MIPDAQVDEVRARADIVEIVGEVVQLKRSGKDFKARMRGIFLKNLPRFFHPDAVSY